MSPLLWLLRSICLLFVLFSWQVVLACKVAILAHVILLMVFSFLPHVFSKLVSMAFCIQVTFKLFRVVFIESITFELYFGCESSPSQLVWHVSPSGCFHRVCGLPVRLFCRVSLSLSYFAFHLVLQRVWLTRCFHGLCCLQVVFMASAAVKSADFWHQALSDNVILRVLPSIFNCLLHVSLFSFFSLYGANPFQATFMIFSAPNLVFVGCVAFSLLFSHLLLLYKFYSGCCAPLFRTVFSWYIASSVHVCDTLFWSCI